MALSAGRRESALRLVEASKSPTDQKEAEITRQSALYRQKFNLLKSVECAPREAVELDALPKVSAPGQAGCSAVIEYREWAQEWRIRTQVEAANTTPPELDGPRVSEMLSHRGARKIAESCEFMSKVRGGYKTFVTGTFDESTRGKIATGETTIQREVSRCMDALQKMYSRGWTDKKTGDRVPGHDGGLAYCWVVEVPKNENGEDNPHVHILLGWRVEYRNFEGWAARLESVWGNGYFHLEKIKDCTCAGAYMAKAAGYMTKGEDGQQGQVKGNRYGISAAARAPDWVTLSRHQLHTMSQIIADIYDHLTVKHGAAYRERKRLNRELESTPKTAKSARQRIGQRLQLVREQLNRLPVRANKYQLILKGQEAYSRFLFWAQGMHQQTASRPAWLPELPDALRWSPGPAPAARDGLYWRKLKAAFQQLKRRRHAITNEIGAALVEQLQEMRDAALSAWEQYQLEAA